MNETGAATRARRYNRRRVPAVTAWRAGAQAGAPAPAGPRPRGVRAGHAGLPAKAILRAARLLHPSPGGACLAGHFE